MGSVYLTQGSGKLYYFTLTIVHSYNLIVLQLNWQIIICGAHHLTTGDVHNFDYQSFCIFITVLFCLFLIQLQQAIVTVVLSHLTTAEVLFFFFKDDRSFSIYKIPLTILKKLLTFFVVVCFLIQLQQAIVTVVLSICRCSTETLYRFNWLLGLWCSTVNDHSDTLQLVLSIFQQLSCSTVEFDSRDKFYIYVT